jgi:hypothetical protein
LVLGHGFDSSTEKLQAEMDPHRVPLVQFVKTNEIGPNMPTAMEILTVKDGTVVSSKSDSRSEVRLSMLRVMIWRVSGLLKGARISTML